MKKTERRDGAIAAISSYFLWGFLPLYFTFLTPTGPWEIVSWRILWSLVFCVILLAATRQLGSIFRLLRNKRVALFTLAAGLLVYINWQFYIIASITGRILEGSLGYFINPLITILFGVLILGERLRPLQWAAMTFGAVAVTVMIVGYGQVPWLSFVLAGSFGLYGLVKNRIGGTVTATESLTLETVWLTPIAVILLISTSLSTGLIFGHENLGMSILLALLGPVTAIPLLLFGYASGRVPLSWMGFMQFIAPSMQFMVGVFVGHEPLPPIRLLGFVIVWLGLSLLAIDIWRNGRKVKSQKTK